jgi:hypothetical protein
MANIIRFLEAVGRDAELQRAARCDLADALNQAGIDQSLQSAILIGDRATLDALVGARSKVYCGTFPVKVPPKKPPPKPPGKTPPKAPAKQAPAKKSPGKKALGTSPRARSVAPRAGA